MADNSITWLKQHERLLIVFMVLLAGAWLGNKYIDNRAKETALQYSAAEKEATTAKTQAEQASAQYQMTIDALSKQNALLETVIAQRQSITSQKVTQVMQPAKTATDVLADLKNAYSGQLDLSSVTVDLNKLSFPVPIVQQFTATKIEKDAAVANFADEQSLVLNTQTELDKCSALVSSLNKELSANDASCKAEVASVKAEARKSKKTWFLIGFTAGLATRILGHF